MMFERFTDGARQLVVQAQREARRLGHNYIGCEHLLLAATESGEPASAVLRDQGITPERVEAEILRTIGHGTGGHPGPADTAGSADPLRGLDHEALAAIGIDLDVVRARIEAAFGPDALDRAVLAHRRAVQERRRRSRRPTWAKGPVAELMRRRRTRRGIRPGPGPRAVGPRNPGPAPSGHIPFTPRAKKSLELSLRESKALHDDYIGVQHLILAQLAISDGMGRQIMSSLGVSNESLRAAILARYRKAS
jgi:ATP-dependent Clp protease ATP-binding subunit ClpA